MNKLRNNIPFQISSDEIFCVASVPCHNLDQSTCTQNIETEITPDFPNINDLMNQDNKEQDQYFYHTDHLGSSSWLTTATGNANQHLAYLPYGEQFIDERKADDSRDIRFKFTAKERDTETGLDYFGARYYSSGLSVWLSVDALAGKYPSLSPYSYCSNNPIVFIDLDGMATNPIYNTNGEYIANTKEGFTGEVLIVNSINGPYLDYANMTASEAKATGAQTYDSQRATLTNEAKSKIWTHIVSHFEGLQVYDKKFSMSTINGSKIKYSSSMKGSWGVPKNQTGTGQGDIYGSDKYNYETTVENIASSIIIHEWYSHIQQGTNDSYKSHRLAYKNVINYKKFWNSTTDKYKGFNVRALRFYTKKETGRTHVDPLYRRIYNKYFKR